MQLLMFLSYKFSLSFLLFQILGPRARAFNCRGGISTDFDMVGRFRVEISQPINRAILHWQNLYSMCREFPERKICRKPRISGLTWPDINSLSFCWCERLKWCV